MRWSHVDREPALPLQDRLALHALRLKEEAQALQPGPERDAMIRRARHAETDSQSGRLAVIAGAADTRLNWITTKLAGDGAWHLTQEGCSTSKWPGSPPSF